MITRDTVLLEGLYKTITENREIANLLNRFVAIPFTDAPKFIVATVQCDDVDRLNGQVEHIKCVVSPETRQKYLVPRNGGFYVPVPEEQHGHLAGDKVADNWKIFNINSKQLSHILDGLESHESSLDDYYSAVERIGSFMRWYYPKV
jgi:hypothetical protein